MADAKTERLFLRTVEFWGHFVVGGLKNFKLLPDISFDGGFQKIVLSSLLLFLCSYFSNDLDDNQ